MLSACAVVPVVLLTAAHVVDAARTVEVRSISPADGKRVKLRSQPTFKVRLLGRVGGEAQVDYAVFLRVSRSKELHQLPRTSKADRDVIAADVFIGEMKTANRAGGRTFTLTPPEYAYSQYWLNHKGSYYWQAYYILCIREEGKCVHRGKVNRIHVGG